MFPSQLQRSACGAFAHLRDTRTLGGWHCRMRQRQRMKVCAAVAAACASVAAAVWFVGCGYWAHSTCLCCHEQAEAARHRERQNRASLRYRQTAKRMRLTPVATSRRTATMTVCFVCALRRPHVCDGVRCSRRARGPCDRRLRPSARGAPRCALSLLPARREWQVERGQSVSPQAAGRALCAEVVAIMGSRFVGRTEVCSHATCCVV